MRCIGWLAGVVLVVSGLAAPSARAAKNESPVAVDPGVRNWLGARTAQMLATADRAEIVRVDPEEIDGKAKTKPPPNVGGYPIVGKSHPLSPGFLEAFRNVLLDRTTHDIPAGGGFEMKLCGPIEPGVALRFWAKADKAGRAPLEILLCFECDDLLVVGPNRDPQSMSPGALALLRLSAAALPDFPELDELLARRSQEESRQSLFRSLFPADLQLEMRGDSTMSTRDWTAAEERLKTAGTAVRLRARYPSPDLVRLAGRALALRDGDWSEMDRGTEVVVGAVEGLTDAQLLAGMQGIRGDQLALAGVSELFNFGVGRHLTPEVRAVWLPLLAEAALTQAGSAPRCELTVSLGAAGAKGVPLLLKLRRGEIVFPKSTARHRHSDEDPTPPACALLALVHADRAKAADELRVWHPEGPLDVAVARVVGAELGNGNVADPELFKMKSGVVALATLDVYQTHPSVAAMDVLAAEAIGHDFGWVRERAGDVFKALTGVDLTTVRWDERPARVQGWWKEHRGDWRAPGGKAK